MRVYYYEKYKETKINSPPSFRYSMVQLKVFSNFRFIPYYSTILFGSIA